jgi:putative exosortase-associated protein (TIGR04073 family)
VKYIKEEAYMNKALLFLCVFVCVVFLPAGALRSPAWAEDQTEDSSATPLNKLGRGAVNIASCITEVPFEMVKVSQEKDPLVGCTLGLAQGFFNAVMRGFTGFIDVITFPIPPYNRPLMEPEYVFKGTDDMIKDKVW